MQRLNERVVITGMGILCALGDDYEQILKQMKQMKTGISTVKRFNTDKFQSHIGAEIKEYPFANYLSKDQRQQYDACAQYAIVAITKALKDSGLNIGEANNERTGLALGTCNGGILSLEEQWTLEQLDEARTARYPYYQQGDDVAAHFNMCGPVITMNTACAASGNAIGFAYDMIRGGYADVMVAGGSDPLSHSVYAGFNVLRALNPEPTSPFGDRYGLSLGEGSSFIVLESLSQALKRGAKIYGEICGYGMSNDAYHSTASDPEGRGMQVAVEMALERAAVDKEQIGYINAHGTGTKANDISELNGLRSVFGTKSLSEIPLSSSKAYFGHNLGASAAVELTTSLYAVQQGLLPATLHHDAIREGCEGANIISNQMIEGYPEFMLCNNSAFGGHNVSILTQMKQDHHDEDVKMISKSKQQPKRVGIVGMGQIGNLGNLQGDICAGLHTVISKSERELGLFSLKNYDAALYERRMDQLCQYSIGSGHLAMQDAGWCIDEEQGKHTGLIYGTSRGSLDSIGRYLSSVFDNGPEFASSIHFPFYVLNAISGKMAQKLKLRGYSSSISTGGNDGLMSVFYGAEMIRSGVHQKFIVGAGDELSPLSTKLNKAKGLHMSRYSMSEGSCCLALADLDSELSDEVKVYAEIKGCGVSFNGKELPQKGSGLKYAVHSAIQQANLKPKDIDFILLNSIGRPQELENERQFLGEMMGERKIPILCFNDCWGYGESFSSLQHVALAASLLNGSDLTKDQLNQLIGTSLPLRNGLVVSSSVNGNNIALVLSKS